jgi:Coenzyme PQQ synthesis protein D (PqqD)
MTESRTVCDVSGYRTLGLAMSVESERTQPREGSKIVRVAENVRSTHSHDGGIVLDVLHGQMFRLNFVGSKILELLKQGSSEPQIAEQLAREFGIDRATAEADVREFVETLEKHHLLTVRDGNSLT